MSTKDESTKQDLPHIGVSAQYLKDFSFESPGAPASLLKMSKSPQIDLSLDLNIRKLEDDDYFEVEIIIEAKAMYENQTLFIVDLKYAGVFNLINIPEDQQQLLLAIRCPEIIFPFARKLIADITQAGGFQPLMIDPINFGALYHKRMVENQN